MYYFNEERIPNHKEIKINYLNDYKKKKTHRSTDNIFGTYRGYTLHTIYNNFLINPYLVRKKLYQNAMNKNMQKSQILKNNNKYLYNRKLNELNQSFNNETKGGGYTGSYTNFNDNSNYMNYNIEENNYNQERNLKFPKINDNQNYFNKEKYINIRKKIINEEFKNKQIYENNLKEINDINLSLRSDASKYQKIPKKYFNNNMIMERPIEYIIKNNKKYDDSFYTNKNDKLYLSYDNRGRNNRYSNKSVDFALEYDNKYISPVVAKIAKHNYLMKNPYSEKDEYLGPSKLTNNPILYPISTYKFDFDRYIKNYYVNKFI